MAGYSPWGHKASDTNEKLSLFISLFLELLRNKPAKLVEKELRVSRRTNIPHKSQPWEQVVWCGQKRGTPGSEHVRLDFPETAYLELL